MPVTSSQVNNKPFMSVNRKGFPEADNLKRPWKNLSRAVTNPAQDDNSLVVTRGFLAYGLGSTV